MNDLNKVLYSIIFTMSFHENIMYSNISLNWSNNTFHLSIFLLFAKSFFLTIFALYFVSSSK